MEKIKESTLVCLFGAGGYSAIEIMWRGYTHWTMAFVGGLGLLLVYWMNIQLNSLWLWQKCLIGSVTLTTLELAAGAIINLNLGWQVWDYSTLYGNIFGQICPLYTMYWGLLCILLFPLCGWVQKMVNRKRGGAEAAAE